MVPISRVLAALTAVALLALPGIFPSADAASASSLDHDVRREAAEQSRRALGQRHQLSAEQIGLVESSMMRFSDIGLQRPPHVVVSFHDDVEQCAGNLGLSTVENQLPRIRICWSHEDPGVQRVVREQALVHEVAHVWLDANVSDISRNEFVALTGSDSWNLGSTTWTERGVERAAELLTWAALDPTVLFVDTDAVACNRWVLGYTALTGKQAPETIENCR